MPGKCGWRYVAIFFFMMLLLPALIFAADIGFLPVQKNSVGTAVAPWEIALPPGKEIKTQEKSSGEVAAGWQVVEGEYKTVGLAALESFRILARSEAKEDKFISDDGTFAAASQWVPLRLYCYLSKKSVVRLHFKMPTIAADAQPASVFIRNLRIRPWQLTPEKNLLGNSDFSLGQIAELPALWHYYRKQANPGDFSLVADSSFKGGQRTLRIRGDGEQWRTLQGGAFPITQGGRLTFSVWARSPDPQVSMRIFILGDRYRLNQSRDFSLTPSWRHYEVSVLCGQDYAHPLFWPRIGTANKGRIFLAAARFTWQEKGAEDSKKPSPEWLGTSSRNLLLNPGFEFGYTNWMFDRFRQKGFEDRVQQATAPVDTILPRVGIAQSAAFLLPYGRSLISGCVPIQRGKTYTVSVSARSTKGTGELFIFLLDPGWKIFSKRFKNIPTDRWTRYSYTFVWNKPSKQGRAYLRIDSRGDDTLLLDNVQLEEGELTNYATAPVELGILAPQGNLHARNSSPVYLLKTLPSAKLSSAVYKVELVVRDGWKKERLRQTFEMSGTRPQTQPLNLPMNRLGIFHVELTARDAAGEVLGRSFHRYAVIDPTAPGENSQGLLFGIDYENSAMQTWLARKDAPSLRQLGIGLNRFFLFLRKLDGVPTEAYLASLRATCRTQKNVGIAQIACLNNVPPSLQASIIDTDNPSDEALAALGEYYKPFVVGLQKEVRYWEILNEPNLWRYRKGEKKGFSTMPPEKYVRLLRVMYKLIKEIDPKLQVVAPCLNGARFPYIEKLMALGAAKYMDVFSFHSYRASPDNPDTYADLMHFREILERGGFHGQLINTEQYYGANLFMMHGSDEETKRAYYVPGTEELRAAGRSIRNYIHHAAAGISYCAFIPKQTLLRRGGVDGGFLYDLAPAYSAAAHFLRFAGRGVPVSVGFAMRAFLFAEASDGPLLTLHTPEPSLSGHLHLSGTFTAFDLMGNQLTATEIAKGLPLSTEPIYVRFPQGTTAQKIRTNLLNAEVSGFGVPVTAEVRLADDRSLQVSVSNLQNRVLAGKVRIVKLPEGWSFDKQEASFAELKPDATAHLSFKSSGLPIKPLGRYPLSIIVETGDTFIKKEVTLAPLLVQKLAPIKADGDPSEWQKMNWLTLGKLQLSKKFSPTLDRKDDADLSARLACAWDEKGFALCVEVTDDVWMPPSSPAFAWQNDSLQIYFDQRNNASELRPHYDADDIVYAISLVKGKPVAYVEKGTDDRYLGEANSATGIDRAVKVGIQRKGNKTIYEVFFPAAVLPRTVLHAGRGFGFSLLINDNDGKGRKTGLTLSPKGTEPHDQPVDFRDLILVP